MAIVASFFLTTVCSSILRVTRIEFASYKLEMISRIVLTTTVPTENSILQRIGKVRELRRANHNSIVRCAWRCSIGFKVHDGFSWLEASPSRTWGSCRCSSSAPILRRKGLRRPVVHTLALCLPLSALERCLS
jgi:hypothetical protein